MITRRSILKLLGVSPVIAISVAAAAVTEPQGPPPLLVGKHPRNATAREVEGLLEALQGLGSASVCVIPEGYEIERIEYRGDGTASKARSLELQRGMHEADRHVLEAFERFIAERKP